jgi:hypothetical protein
MTIKVKFEHFIEFQKKYGTYYIDKKQGYYVCADSKKELLEKHNIIPIINEMLDGTKTDYDLFENDNDYLIIFKTKSKNEYRFDLMKEPSTYIYHLGFSNTNNLSYEDITNLNESIEVFSKLSYILKDLNKKLNVSEYCIGATGNLKKDRIYEYFMKYVKSFEKRKTEQYELGWALYFTI